MNKSVFIKLMRKYGDAYVTYVSPNSKKEKFNVGTIDVDNDYIKGKNMNFSPDENKVVLFCWDTDSFRQIDPETVIRVEPLAAELEKARTRNVRRYNGGSNIRG
jgi:hypothetical protein